VTVRTPKGNYSADRLLITAGPWAPRVLAELGLPLRVTRQVLCWFAPEGSLDDFRPERFPIYLFDESHGTPLIYGFPVTGADTEWVKVALHGSDDVCSPETVNREMRPEDEAVIRERLGTTVPRLAGRLLRAEICLYTMTPDEHFVIGQHPEHPAVTLAAGHSGHGFKFAPVLGEVLAISYPLVRSPSTSTCSPSPP
jgi:sarcosine oxidase